MIRDTLDLLRIKDWLKNLIIFFPIIFSGLITDFHHYYPLFSSFILFSLVSSFVYVINDILDIRSDQLHPYKKLHKPLASNKLSLKYAYFLLVVLFLINLYLININNKISYHIFAYLILSLSYNFILKKLPFIEIVVISLGYVVRIDAGSTVISLKSTFLILFSSFFLAFFFICLKRIGELNNFKNNLQNYLTRNTLKYYSVHLLKRLSLVSVLLLMLLIIIYILNKNLMMLFLFPLIIFFLIRYYSITRNTTIGERPIAATFNDKYLLFVSLISILLLIYIYI